MKKKILNALLMGAVLVTSAGFTSCKYDDGDVKSRLDVVEGKLGEIAKQIGDLQARGVGITSASQDASGNWTLKLSDGNTVTINAGGADVTVSETDNAFIIKVGDKEYQLTKGGAAAQLIYSPQYTDGIEVFESAPVNVQFLMSPALKTLDDAVITILEAHELKTRAGSSLFEVAGDASISGDIITIPIRATEAETGKTYAIAVILTQNGKDYVSNYFTASVGANEYKAEVLEDYTFASVVTDAQKGEVTQNAAGDDTWTWSATLPADMVDDFSFADFFTGVPAGATYEIAAADKQSGNAADKYEVLANSLSKDGSWSLNGRPGCDFPDGFIVNIKVDGIIKMKVSWKFIDPLKDVDFKSTLSSMGQHYELAGTNNDNFFKAGANDLDFPKLVMQASDSDDQYITIRHGNANKFIKEEFPNYSVSLNVTDDVIYNNGTRLVLGEVGQKYAKNSKGVYYLNVQGSIASSNRRNLERPAAEGSDENIAWCGGNCSGEIIQGYDGINIEDPYGITVTDDGHIVTTSAYQGWAFRIGLQARYQYVYGEKQLGSGQLGYVWVNRRTCPDGVQDPAAQ